MKCFFCGRNFGTLKLESGKIGICESCASRMVSLDMDLKSVTGGPLKCQACRKKFAKVMEIGPNEIFVCKRCVGRTVLVKPPKFPPSDPFAIGSCPPNAFVYAHPEELEAIKRVFREGKVAVMMGPLGIGKTALCQHLVRELMTEGLTSDASQQVVPAFVDAAAYKSVDELIKGLVLELALDATGDRAHLFRIFTHWPQEHREKLALMIDNIAECGGDVNELGEFLRAVADVENVAVILNGERKRIKKLFEAVPALEDRVQAEVEVNRMNREQVEEMLKLRLKLNNCEDLFDGEALREIYKLSRGVPRRALKAASKAFEFARAENVRIDKGVVRRANRIGIISRLFRR